MALSYLIDACGENYPIDKSLQPWRNVGQRKIKGVTEMIKQGVNSPLVSSCGRLFDAVSFLTGVAPAEMEFEAEAPMRLEAVATTGGSYRFSVLEDSCGTAPAQISFGSMIRAIVKDLGQGIPASLISAKFHNTLARVILTISEKARLESGIDTVVLVGGVFLNRRLLVTASHLLEKKGFTVLRPVQYSPNDESISVGQIAYALNRLQP
jgi:hydrogenase maturation protein HypF